MLAPPGFGSPLHRHLQVVLHELRRAQGVLSWKVLNGIAERIGFEVELFEAHGRVKFEDYLNDLLIIVHFKHDLDSRVMRVVDVAAQAPSERLKIGPIPLELRIVSSPEIAGPAQAKTDVPPRAATYVGYLLLSREHQQAIIGDLEERFADTMVPRYGRRAAVIWFWRQILGSALAMMPARAWNFFALRSMFDYFTKWIGH